MARVARTFETPVRVREEVGLHRDEEVVLGGVPFPPGLLTDPSRLTLVSTDGTPTPIQTSVLERWPDRSVRWASVAFLATVGPGGSWDGILYADDPDSLRRPVTRPVRASRSNSSVVDLCSDLLKLAVGRHANGFIEGVPGILSCDVEAVLDTGDVYRLSTAAATEVEVLETGPLLASATLSATFDSGHPAPLRFEVVVELVAGRPECRLDVRLVCTPEAPELQLARWSLLLKIDSRAGTCGAYGDEHWSQHPFVIASSISNPVRHPFATSEVASSFDDWVTRWDDHGDRRSKFYELIGHHATNWVGAEETAARTSRVIVAARRFAENHPNELAYSRTGIEVRIWPTSAGPIELAQGMSKTREILIRVQDRDDRDNGAGHRFDARLIPTLGVGSIENVVVPEILPLMVERYPNLEARIRSHLFGWYQGTQLYGFLDFGDDVQPDWGQRRAFRDNNEHDVLHALLLHYIRNPERAYFDAAEALADHIVDVDQIAYSNRNELELGGVREHGQHHRHYFLVETPSGIRETSVDSAHLWVEGLLLFSVLTGRRRYAEAADRIGGCLLRLADAGLCRPEPGPRYAGWPLIALVALYRSTNRRPYLDGALRIAETALAAQDEDGRWPTRSGYWEGFCPWMHAILLTGIARLMSVQRTPDLEAAFHAGANALVELGRVGGAFFDIDRFDGRQPRYPGAIREALACAFDVTQDRRFLEVGLAGGESWYPAQEARIHALDLSEWRGHLPFLARAHSAGILEDLRS